MSDHTEFRFADRHIGPDRAAAAAMLAVIGVDSLDDLAARALPADILDPLTPAGAAPQHHAKPGLVYRLLPVPAGDQPGSAGSTAELPDHGRRPHRPGDRQRIDAR